MKIKTLLATSLLAGTALFAGNYTVDPAHSSADFSVKHAMISTVKGNFTKFNGAFEYDEATKTLKSLTGTIDAASINTGIEKETPIYVQQNCLMLRSIQPLRLRSIPSRVTKRMVN